MIFRLDVQPILRLGHHKGSLSSKKKDASTCISTDRILKINRLAYDRDFLGILKTLHYSLIPRRAEPNASFDSNLIIRIDLIIIYVACGI
jgi:hypothetical protein